MNSRTSGASLVWPEAASPVQRRRKPRATAGSAEKMMVGMARALVGVPVGFLQAQQCGSEARESLVGRPGYVSEVRCRSDTAMHHAPAH